MKIKITPQEIVKISKNKVNECHDIFKKPLNLTDASKVLNAVLPQLEQKISDMLDEEVYDELMRKNDGHGYIFKQLTKPFKGVNNYE